MSKSTSYERVLEFGQKKYGIEVKFKDESIFMRVLGFLLFFNPKFMTRFVTVVGNTIYFPTRQRLEQNPDAAAQVLCHEMIHIADERQVGSLFFRLSYLFPQCLAVLSLSSFAVGPWALLFLLFLLPLPAPFRAFWELRGYAVTDAVLYRKTGYFSKTAWMTSQYRSSSYFFMWPFLEGVYPEIEKNRKLAMNGRLHEKIPASVNILNAYFEKADDVL